MQGRTGAGVSPKRAGALRLEVREPFTHREAAEPRDPTRAAIKRRKTPREHEIQVNL